jgi:hypothetical protein
LAKASVEVWKTGSLKVEYKNPAYLVDFTFSKPNIFQRNKLRRNVSEEF